MAHLIIGDVSGIHYYKARVCFNYTRFPIPSPEEEKDFYTRFSPPSFLWEKTEDGHTWDIPNVWGIESRAQEAHVEIDSLYLRVDNPDNYRWMDKLEKGKIYLLVPAQWSKSSPAANFRIRDTFGLTLLWQNNERTNKFAATASLALFECTHSLYQIEYTTPRGHFRMRGYSLPPYGIQYHNKMHHATTWEEGFPT